MLTLELSKLENETIYSCYKKKEMFEEKEKQW